MEQKNKLVPIVELTMGQNTRLQARMAIDTLMESVASIGLSTPIWVWKVGEMFEVLRGHRRLTAIRKIENERPSAFAAHFSKGIPCVIMSGITSAEALALKVDHGNEMPLTDGYELQLCANLLFASGSTEEAVILSLSGLMDLISPMKAARLSELQAIKKLAAEAEAAGEKLLAGMKRDEADKLVAEYRRGMVQGLHNAYRCPSIVMVALAKRAGEAVPEEFKTEFLPSLTAGDIKGLWKCHTQDMTILENGRPKFSQSRVGPAFRQAWEKLVAQEQADAGKEKSPKPKAMPATEILKDLKEGLKLRSELACRLSGYHAGQKEEATMLSALDAKSYAGDLVSTYNNELWVMVTEEAAKIERQLIEADKATAVVAPVEA
jgi:hypothetical protein